VPTPKGVVPSSLPKAQARHRRNIAVRRLCHWLDSDPSPEDRRYVATILLDGIEDTDTAGATR
jgi:hypothetical protein